MFTRRGVLATAASGAAALVLPRARAADKEIYPSRPITIVVPLPAGTATDSQVRVIAAFLSERVGQPVVILNKPNAEGSVGMDFASRETPDGYMLATVTNGFIGYEALHGKQAWDVRDFVPVAIGRMAENPQFLVVNPALPVRSVSQLIGYVRAQAGKFNIGVGNTSGRMSFAMFRHLTGLDVVRVAYTGEPPIVRDVSAGHIKCGFVLGGASYGNILAGSLRPLAVIDRKRTRLLPDVPAIVEEFPEFDDIASIAPSGSLAAVPGTPLDIVEYLSGHLRAVLSDPRVIEAFLSTGSIPHPSTRQECQVWMNDQIVQFPRLVEKYDLKTALRNDIK